MKNNVIIITKGTMSREDKIKEVILILQKKTDDKTIREVIYLLNSCLLDPKKKYIVSNYYELGN